MKIILFYITIFWFSISLQAQVNSINKSRDQKIKNTKNKNNNYVAIESFYFMPMNSVDTLKYYDKKNHACDEYEYSQVIFQSEDSAVFSVGEGEVIAVAGIDNMKAVIIRKKEYFYTYSNLNTVLVKKGLKIKLDHMIGYAAKDLDGTMPSLDFYLNTKNGSIALSKNNFKSRK